MLVPVLVLLVLADALAGSFAIAPAPLAALDLDPNDNDAEAGFAVDDGDEDDTFWRVLALSHSLSLSSTLPPPSCLPILILIGGSMYVYTNWRLAWANFSLSRSPMEPRPRNPYVCSLRLLSPLLPRACCAAGELCLLGRLHVAYFLAYSRRYKRIWFLALSSMENVLWRRGLDSQLFLLS